MRFLSITMLVLLLAVLRSILDESSITSFDFWSRIIISIILVAAAVAHTKQNRVKKNCIFLIFAGAVAFMGGLAFVGPALLNSSNWQILESLSLVLFGLFLIIYGAFKDEKIYSVIKDDKRGVFRNSSPN